MTPAARSPFLEIPEAEWVCANELCFAIYDSYPVSPGHVLVITRRVVPTFFECTAAEQQALMALVGEVKALLDERLEPKPVTTATLTPDGGSPVPLTPALSGTVFPVGTYTLDLAGELDDAAFPLAIAINTTAVPERATLGLAAAGLGCAAAGFWRRRRKRADRSLALPPRFLN